MEDFVTGLTSNVNVAAFWDTIGPVAPLVGVAILIGIGYMVVRKVVGGAGKAKAKL